MIVHVDLNGMSSKTSKLGSTSDLIHSVYWSFGFFQIFEYLQCLTAYCFIHLEIKFDIRNLSFLTSDSEHNDVLAFYLYGYIFRFSS